VHNLNEQLNVGYARESRRCIDTDMDGRTGSEVRVPKRRKLTLGTGHKEMTGMQPRTDVQGRWWEDR